MNTINDPPVSTNLIRIHDPKILKRPRARSLPFAVLSAWIAVYDSALRAASLLLYYPRVVSAKFAVETFEAAMPNYYDDYYDLILTMYKAGFNNIN